MTCKDNGGPAFPCKHRDPEAMEILKDAQKDGTPMYAIRDLAELHPGMTLRDYFAAKAMQAAITNPTWGSGFSIQKRARWAYEQADVMLAHREKRR